MDFFKNYFSRRSVLLLWDVADRVVPDFLLAVSSIPNGK